MPAASKPINTPAQVLFASLVGTTVEFFDFYIYATAAVIVFPLLFFPKGDETAATLQSPPRCRSTDTKLLRRFTGRCCRPRARSIP